MNPNPIELQQGMDALLTVPDACECAELRDGHGRPLFTRACLYRAVREGQKDRAGTIVRLPARRIGRKIYVTPRDVFDWAARLEQGQPEATVDRVTTPAARVKGRRAASDRAEAAARRLREQGL